MLGRVAGWPCACPEPSASTGVWSMCPGTSLRSTWKDPQPGTNGSSFPSISHLTASRGRWTRARV
eukprot:11125122-Prorocentrum_lima.AAC.1